MPPLDPLVRPEELAEDRCPVLLRPADIVEATRLRLPEYDGLTRVPELLEGR